MTRPTVFIKVPRESTARSRSTVLRGPDQRTVDGTGITVIEGPIGEGPRGRGGYGAAPRAEGAGVVVVGLEEPVFDLVLDAVGLVGGLDVHEGHSGSLAPAVVVIFVVTEDLHTLDSTEPFEVLFNPVLGEPRGEVAHPEVSSFADHGGRERQPRWPRLYSSRLFFRGCGINFGFEIATKMAPVWPVNITRSCLWPLI